MFSKRENSLWRYRALLPVLQDKHIISLGEGCTPLLTLKNLGASIGLSDLRMKDESFNATGSFKARGMSVAISKARELGIKEVCVPTAGNAGGALAAYGAAAGMTSRIYMPEDTPAINIYECSAYGAEVHRVRGVISDAAKVMNDQMQGKVWFDPQVPASFSLLQNYPNPFNPSTKIQYSLPGNHLVTLKVYDLLGREVTTLVNEKQAAGSYQVEFGTDGLASGVYFSRLRAGSFVETKKMLLMK